MAGEIGGGEVGRDAPGFLGRRLRMGENVADKIDQFLNLNGNHVRIFGL